MYGEGNKWRYLIGFGLVIVLLFVIIFMIVRGGGDESSNVPETERTLVSYATDDNVTVTNHIIGPIVAPQNHNEVEISVTNTTATINVINGYDGNVVNSRSYPMTTEAFTEFLSALELAEFTEGNTDEALADDEGYCATGQRYIFGLNEGSNNVQRLWSTSCGGTKTFRGNTSATLNLFQNMIPDYDEIIDEANLNGSSNFGL